MKDSSSASPLVLSAEELKCLKQYLPLPTSLDTLVQAGPLDLSETFYAPTASFFSHEMSFTARQGEDAVRVLLAKANSKIALLDGSGRSLVAQSRPVESGRAQLLIATRLRPDTVYTIVLEFSEAAGGQDGEAAAACEHFVMAVKTWDTQ